MGASSTEGMVGRAFRLMRYYLPTEALHRLTGSRECVLPARRRRIACVGLATRSFERETPAREAARSTARPAPATRLA